MYLSFATAIAYPTVGYLKLKEELKTSRAAVYRMAQESAISGCATLDLPTSIVVIGGSYEEVRKGLDRTVADLDKFTSELDKANRANRKGVVRSVEVPSHLGL